MRNLIMDMKPKDKEETKKAGLNKDGVLFTNKTELVDLPKKDVVKVFFKLLIYILQKNDGPTLRKAIRRKLNDNEFFTALGMFLN